MGKSAGTSQSLRRQSSLENMRGWGVCRQVGVRWAGSIYEGGSRASVGTKPAPEMEPAQEWWARSSLYFILGRDLLQNRNVYHSVLR